MNYWSLISLVVGALSVHNAMGADGCGGAVGEHVGGYSVRCGEKCTGPRGYCTCGKGNKKFNVFDSTTWCCNASQCQKTGKDIVCEKGTPIPLTTPCNGKCNTGRSYFASRQYWTCDGKKQCIKIQHWQDKVHHCLDRSDERLRQEDVFLPIQWNLLTPCKEGQSWAGVRCSNQGLPADCLEYALWCNENNVMKCHELGGRTSVHKEVCSNNTFWTRQTCRYDGKKGRRCSSGNSGQCYYPGSRNHLFVQETCKDGSHDIRSKSKNSSCPPKYISCKVNGKDSCLAPFLHCDMHPQCDDGKDEKDCKYVYKMKGLTKPRGTRTCHHLHYGPNNTIKKPEVEILALVCDGGEPECDGGVDEMCDPLLTRAQLCE